jgi:hypothetical protein
MKMLHRIGHTQASQIMADQNDLWIKIYISHSHTFNPSRVSLQADCKNTYDLIMSIIMGL